MAVTTSHNEARVLPNKRLQGGGTGWRKKPGKGTAIHQNRYPEYETKGLLARFVKAPPPFFCF